MGEIQVGVVVNGTFEIAPADRQRFLETVRPHLADTVRNAKGCVYYSMAADISNENLFHLVEGWENQAALDEHLGSERLEAARARISSILMKDYQMSVYTIASRVRYVPDNLRIR